MAIDLETRPNAEYEFRPVLAGSVFFEVKASSEARIILCPDTEDRSPKYVVVLGGNLNNVSQIFRNGTEIPVAQQNTSGILSCAEYRKYRISWENGKITVARQGNVTPILYYEDSLPFGIGYYGVGSGTGPQPGYEAFWKLEGPRGSKREITTKNNSETNDVEYNFFPVRMGRLVADIKSGGEAHIVLASTTKITNSKYEIILGQGPRHRNTIILHYFAGHTPDEVWKDSGKEILNGREFSQFVIEWKDGDISVKHEGKILVELRDPREQEPLGISYFAVKTQGELGFWKLESCDLRKIEAETETSAFSQFFADLWEVCTFRCCCPSQS